MRVRIKDEFGQPINLLRVDKTEFSFPREDGGYLSKRDFAIIDAEAGIVEVLLTPFEKSALRVGEKQDFFAKMVVGDEILTVQFAKGLDVLWDAQDERKLVDEQKSRI